MTGDVRQGGGKEPVGSALMSKLPPWVIGSIPPGTLSCPTEEQGCQCMLIYHFLSKSLVGGGVQSLTLWGCSAPRLSRLPWCGGKLQDSSWEMPLPEVGTSQNTWEPQLQVNSDGAWKKREGREQHPLHFPSTQKV